MRALRLVCVGILVLAGSFFAAGPATTDGKAVRGGKGAVKELLNPLEVRSQGGLCDVVLEAAVNDRDFPAATGDNYRLRAPVYILRKVNYGTVYENGRRVKEKEKVELKGAGELVGPTLRVRKGHWLRIRVRNRLDPNLLPAEVENPPADYPQGFASTNLHTHGLHVSPKGKGDNIYVEIKPSEDHQFEYQVLRNHPTGTFWYHPHKHGSVALQLTGGMAGALIVDEEKEDLLFPPQGAPTEKVLVLQQVHGSLADPNGKLLAAQPGDIYDKAKSAKALAPPTPGLPALRRSWRFLKGLRAARANLAARVKAAKAPPAAQAGAPNDCPDAVTDPQDSHNPASEWLLVNGQATGANAPTITVQQGKVQRWRFIHAGVDEVIHIAVVKTVTTNGVTTREYVPLQEVAVDGIPRDRLVPRQHYYLYPGYRWDVLFQVPDDYFDPKKTTNLELYSECAPASRTLSGFDAPKQRIATLNVVKGDGKTTALPSPDVVRGRVPPEFLGDISDQEVGNRRWGLRFDFPDAGPSRFLINGREYTAKLDRFVRLDTAEEWRIESRTGTSNAAGHPFHVHVNPFLHYVYADALSLNFSNPSGVTPSGGTSLVSAGLNEGDSIILSGWLWPGKPFTTGSIAVTKTTTLKDIAAGLNKQLAGAYEALVDQKDYGNTTRPMVIRARRGALRNLVVNVTVSNAQVNMTFTRARELKDRVWRDTLMAPSGRSEVVRMRFRDWTGDTVLHCHIVDHEDQGMMKNIRILGPDEPIPPGGAKVSAHGGRRAARLPTTAPQFSLPDAEGRKHGLRELAGQGVILVFFRGSGCLECARQLQAFNRIQDRLAAVGVKLVAVTSTTREDLRAAQRGLPKGNKLPFLLLADPEHVVFKRYGCLGEEDQVPLHGTFVVDSWGKIRWRDVGDEPYLNVVRVLEEATRVKSSVSAAASAK